MLSVAIGMPLQFFILFAHLLQHNFMIQIDKWYNWGKSKIKRGDISEHNQQDEPKPLFLKFGKQHYPFSA